MLDRSLLHRVESFHEFGPTVWVDVVVPGVDRAGHQPRVPRQGDSVDHREHDDVVVGNGGYGHVLRSVVAVGHLHVVRGERRKGREDGHPACL